MGYSWKYLEHPADIKVEVKADSLRDLFKGALKTLAEILHPENLQTEESITQELNISSLNQEVLLVDFLNEVLTFSDIYNAIFDGVEFKVFRPQRLRAIIKGKRVKSFREEIKGVTYHGISIKKEDNHWRAILLLDV